MQLIRPLGFAFIILIFIIGCGPLYNPNGHNIRQSNIPIEDYSRIVAFPVIVENDTTWINELRFYHVESALDSQRMLYHYFGKWSERYEGKYQGNINQLIWENINLLNDENRYTVIADGTETQTEYFTSFMVFDENNKDFLVDSNPKKDKIVNHLTELMKSDAWHDSDFFNVKD